MNTTETTPSTTTTTTLATETTVPKVPSLPKRAVSAPMTATNPLQVMEGATREDMAKWLGGRSAWVSYRLFPTEEGPKEKQFDVFVGTRDEFATYVDAKGYTKIPSYRAEEYKRPGKTLDLALAASNPSATPGSTESYDRLVLTDSGAMGAEPYTLPTHIVATFNKETKTAYIQTELLPARFSVNSILPKWRALTNETQSISGWAVRRA